MKSSRYRPLILTSTMLWLTVILIAMGCKTKPAGEDLRTSISLLSVDEAKKQIAQDLTDGFFDKLTVADMSIQMKTANVPDDIGEARKAYIAMLRQEMLSFSEEDKVFMTETFALVREVIDLTNNALYPESLEVIKTATNHYGPNVYYTREDAIIVPQNIFEDRDAEATMPVMLHEIFHILSRYHPDFRHEMYELIGFRKYDKEIMIPEVIAGRLLTNPDAAYRSYVIDLVDESGNVQPALPLLVSTSDRYKSSNPSFFGYLQFDLYPVIDLGGQPTLGVKSDGSSSLSIEHNADFFRQIKDNTEYIIHPEEIMADNFMMALIAERNGHFEGFSQEGSVLLQEVLDILKDFKKN